jgi:hypothetical protein
VGCSCDYGGEMGKDADVPCCGGQG